MSEKEDTPEEKEEPVAVEELDKMSEKKDTPEEKEKPKAVEELDNKLEVASPLTLSVAAFVCYFLFYISGAALGLWNYYVTINLFFSLGALVFFYIFFFLPVDPMIKND